jgi:hypothetical protein
MIVAVGAFGLAGASVFFVHWARARHGLAALDPPESTWILTEDTVGQESSLGKSAIPWDGLGAVWRFDDLWLLIWGRDVYSAIPTSQLPAEARVFIVRRVRDTGGVVK